MALGSLLVGRSASHSKVEYGRFSSPRAFQGFISGQPIHCDKRRIQFLEIWVRRCKMNVDKEDWVGIELGAFAVWGQLTRAFIGEGNIGDITGET